MNPYEATAMFTETVNAMREADPVGRELSRGCFMFEVNELYQAMQKRYSFPLILEAIDTLAPYIENPRCTCGRNDPNECGEMFRQIVDEIYVVAPMQ